MRQILSIASALAVMALAYWAYVENYATQDALRELARVEARIAERREALGVLEAEWAFLNRPDRLRELAEVNYERLGLLPLSASAFGAAERVPYPPPAGAAAPLEEEGLLAGVPRPAADGQFP